MKKQRYFKLTKTEKSACDAICAIAPMYDLDIDWDLFMDDPVYTRKFAAIIIGHLGSDLRALALQYCKIGYPAGFGVLSAYIQKISKLL